MIDRNVRDATKGQRVFMVDPDTNELATGTLVKNTTNSVIVKWDDIAGECEHFSDEFDLIKCGSIIE